MSTLRRHGLKAAAVLVVLVAVLIGTASASAGQWVQVSCVNPDGSRAPSEGWSGASAGAGLGSNNSAGCAPGAPMFAQLSNQAAVGVGAHETLQYTPPPGSVLNGGSLGVSLFADGGGYNASGTAIVYTPNFAYDASDVLVQCAWGLPACSSKGHDFDGVVTLPAGGGGNVFVSAGCGGTAGFSCNSEGSEGSWSLVRVRWANLILSSDANPGASGFGGTLLAPNASGTADLTFTASDPGGPGVYAVSVEVDGKAVYGATPDTNGGKCVPVGKSASGLMFDASQPCRSSVSVDAPVDTSRLADGTHGLKVVVEDAAGNRSVVYSGLIVIRNGTGTPPGEEPKSGVSVPGLVLTGPLGTANGSGASSGALLHLGGAHLVQRTYAQSAFTARGSLLDPQGRPIAGAELVVLERASGAGARKVVGSVKTSSSGSFEVRFPKGGSRVLTISYSAFSGEPLYTTEATISETVRATVALQITPRHPSATGTITMKVHVDGPVPPQGVLVLVIVKYHGALVPVRRGRSDSAGNFARSYTFHRSVGGFPFFAEVPGYQAGYAFTRGTSKKIVIQTG